LSIYFLLNLPVFLHCHLCDAISARLVIELVVVSEKVLKNKNVKITLLYLCNNIYIKCEYNEFDQSLSVFLVAVF
jgi:hypothetical protein